MMATSKECKRLAEVYFPIAVFSKHSAREKSIRLNFIRDRRGGRLRIPRTSYSGTLRPDSG